MTKIVINGCYGGFSISREAAQYMADRGSNAAKLELENYTGEYRGRWYGYIDCERNDSLLVEAVETLGQDASGSCANLQVVEIPDGVSWVIEEYDGLEHVAESHRTWS